MTDMYQKVTGIKGKRLQKQGEDLTEEQWREVRRGGIGGSDIAAIAGVNPFRSNVDVYLSKVHGDETEDNERMKWGRELEPLVAREYQNRHNYKVQRVKSVLQHTECDIALANVDRLIVAPPANGILEVKCSAWAEAFKNGDIPDMYYCQLQWYLGITGLQWGAFAILLNGNRYIEPDPIHFDKPFFEQLLTVAKNFWKDHVEKKDPPVPFGGVHDKGAHAKLFPHLDEDNWQALDEGWDGLLTHRLLLNGQKKEIEKEVREIDQKLMYTVRDKKYAQSEHCKVTIIDKNSLRFDTKRFAKENPELHKQYSVPQRSRYPLVKKKKEVSK
jgi:putative phage-type endonuclease